MFSFIKNFLSSNDDALYKLSEMDKKLIQEYYKLVRYDILIDHEMDRIAYLIKNIDPYASFYVRQVKETGVLPSDKQIEKIRTACNIFAGMCGFHCQLDESNGVVNV